VITVAQGRFAPGHLGELTQQVPFEMVDAVLAETGRVQQRVRDLPSRVVVYLLLAGCLFAELGYRKVWQRLVAGLDGLPVANPGAAALRQARARVGVAPLRALFDLVRGPAATPPGSGVYWRGLLVCAIDGTTISVPDSLANVTAFGRQTGHHGGSGYPLLRLLAVVCCGTRTVLDAAFGTYRTGETSYAAGLLGCLRPGMVLLADRNFAAGALLAHVVQAKADMLVRAKTGAGGPKLPILARYRDGSYQSMFGGIPVRVIEAEITVATAAGRVTGVYRLITTLLDPHRYPALEIVKLYHLRWEIETAYLELKSSILGGRVLRARTPTGVQQEVYALLVTYQALRTAMADATNSQPGITPDRASFTTALHAARDQVVYAAGIIADAIVDLVGKIGSVVLDDLLPARRLRVNARTVKRAISKYNARGPNIDRRTYQATLNISILAGPTLTTGPEP
jgi:Insertion element 4 transposase N-terminal/Transposase DDE domain